MKKYLLALFAALITFNIFAGVKWNYLPDIFFSGYDKSLFDNDDRTYLDITKGQTSFVLKTADIDELGTLNLYAGGKFDISVYSGNDLLIEKEFIKSKSGIISMDLSGLSVSNFDELTFYIKGEANQVKDIIYEANMFAEFKNEITDPADIQAVKNVITINPVNKEKDKDYVLDLTFDGDTVEGTINYSFGYHKTSFYVTLGREDKKTLHFDYLPYEDNKNIKIEFVPKSGSLLKGSISRSFRDRSLDIFYISDLSPNAKIYNTFNLYDYDTDSEYTGEWGSTAERVFEVRFAKSVFDGKLEFYYMPGLSDAISFEAVYEDGKTATIGQMDTNNTYYDGKNTLFKKDYQYLKSPGYKIFNFNSDKQIAGLRMHLNASKSFCAGGVTEIKAFGLDDDTDNFKIFRPQGGSLFTDIFNVMLYNDDGNLSFIPFINFFQEDWHDSCWYKWGFRSKIRDTVSIYRFEKDKFKFYVHCRLYDDPGIDLTLPQYNVFTTNDITIKGTSDYPIAFVTVNGQRVEKDRDGGRNAFKVNLHFDHEGLYYLETAVNGYFFPFRKRIDTIFIDKTAPEIITVYPVSNYVNTDLTSIKGIIRDLTPYKVEVNGQTAELNGRWFEMRDISLNETQQNKYVIVAYDKAGNKTTKEIYITVDKTPPTIEFVNPQDDYYTNQFNIDVTCKAGDVSGMTLNLRGQQINASSSGTYTFKSVPINAGIDTLEVMAQDEAGNISRADLRLRVDRDPPVFVNMDDTYYTNQNTFNLPVYLKDVAGITLSYGEGTLNKQGTVVEKTLLSDYYYRYKFNAPIDMTGKTSCIITLQGTDQAGNKTAMTVKIIKDQTPPVIVITTPKDGDITPFVKTNVTGTYIEEHLKSIQVNGLDATTDKGKFGYANLPLTIEGNNPVTVTAQDLAGNTTTATVTIVRDTIPPGNPNVHATSIGKKTVEVYWTVNDNSSDIDHYLIKRTLDFEGSTTVKQVKTPKYEDASVDLNISMPYYYYIQAVDRAGNKSQWEQGSTGIVQNYVPQTPGEIYFDGMKLNWNGNEISYSTKIEVYAAEAVEIKDSGTYYSPIYSIKPDHTLLSNPITVSFDIDSATVNKEKLCWFYYNEDTHRWDKIPCWYDSSVNKLTAYMTHFSAYAVKQDMTREFSDTDLSALKSSREDTNISVSEGDGSVTVVENEMTLKGPGQFDFILSRSINSNTLSQNSTNEIPQMKSAKFNKASDKVDIDNQNWLTWNDAYGFEPYSTTNNLNDQYMHAGGWQFNIPRIKGQTIILEEGSLNIDSLVLNGRNEMKQGGFYTVDNTEDKDTLSITVKTLSGKKYRFAPISRTFQGQETNGNVTNFNYVIKDGKVYLTSMPVFPVTKIIYPDGNVLNFEISGSSKIYWNTASDKCINFSQGYCENTVTKEKVEYANDLKMYLYQKIEHWYVKTISDGSRSGEPVINPLTGEYVIETDSKYVYNYDDYYLSSAKYSKNNIGDYTINYDYKSMLANRSIDSYGARHKNFGTNSYPSPVFSIYYPTGKKTDINFSTVSVNRNSRVFSFEKNTMRPESIVTYRKTDSGYVPETKKEYAFDRTDNTPSSIYTSCNINSYKYKNNLWDKDGTENKYFNNFGRIARDANETGESNLVYKGFNGFALYNGSKLDMSNLKNPPQNLSISLTGKTIAAEYNGTKATIETSGGIITLPSGLIADSSNDAIELQGISQGKFNTLVSANYFKLFTTDDGVSVYITIVSLSEIYIYVETGGANSEKIIETQRTGKVADVKSDVTWQKSDYDKFGRQIWNLDSLGNYTSVKYRHDNTSDCVYVNDLDIQDSVESGYLTDITDKSSKTAENNASYDYNEGLPGYLRVNGKTISGGDGATQKYEKYEYNAMNKISAIRSYKADKTTQKNEIRFDYETAKSDIPIKSMGIYGAGGNDPLFYRNYTYEEGSGLMQNVNGAGGYNVDFGYDYLGRNNLINFSDNVSVNYSFNDTASNYERTIQKKGMSDFLQKQRINYFDGKIDSVNYFRNASDSITQYFTFDSLGRRSTSTDFKNGTYAFSYDKGYLKEVDNPDNSTKHFAYSMVQLTKGSEFNQKTVEIRSFDGGMNGKYLETKTFKDIYGNTAGEAVLLNGKWTGKFTVYDRKNRPWKTYSAVLYSLSDESVSVSETDRTVKSENFYDDLGRLIKTKLYQIEYDGSGKHDFIEEYKYDEFDFLTEKINMYKEGSAPKRYSFYKYDGAGNQTKMIETTEDDENSATAMVTDVTYDQNGNIVTVTYPGFDTADKAGHRIVKKYFYDSMNRVTQTVTNADDQEFRKATFYEYDGLGRVYRQYDMRAADTYSDASGYTLKSGIEGYATTFDYDALGRLVTVTYPDGKTDRATYDDNGNLLTVTNGQGGTTTYWYDKANRKIFERSGTEGNYTGSFYTYFENGLLKEKGLSKPIADSYMNDLNNGDIDAIISGLAGNFNSGIYYEYNDAGMTSSIRDPETNTAKITMTYYDDGQLNTKTSKTGAIDSYTYYTGGKVKQNMTTFGDSVLEQSGYEYDENGNLVKYFTGNDSRTVKTFSYDNWGMMTKSTDPWGNEKSVKYNRINMPVEIDDPDGRIETLSYNKDGQITGKDITVNGNGAWTMNETFKYHSMLGTVTGTVFKELTPPSPLSLEKIEGGDTTVTENYEYDFMGSLYKYSFNLDGKGNYDTEYRHDYATGNDFLKYPGKDNFLKYTRDSFGRLTSIGGMSSDNLYTFGYHDGNISRMTSITGETSTFGYDIMGRMTGQTSKFGNETVYGMTNGYDTEKTDSLTSQTVVEKGAGAPTTKTFSYDYDEAVRLTGYSMSNIGGYVNESRYENKRGLSKNDYTDLGEEIKKNRSWLQSVEIASTTNNELESMDATSDDIRVDGSAHSIEIIYNAPKEGIKIITLKKSGDRNGAEKTWFDLYFSESTEPFDPATGTGGYTKLAKEDFDLVLNGDRYVFTLHNTIKAGKLKVHFNRDEINPLYYYLNTYNYSNNEDTTVDKSLNRVEPGYKLTPPAPLSSGIEGGAGINGRLSDVVKIYAFVTSLSDAYKYDSSDRRTATGEYGTANGKISYTDGNKEANRITRQGDKFFRYDKSGRRVIMLSSEGTTIYRYNLEGELARVYFSYKRISINTAAFDKIDDNYDYTGNGFDLIEKNVYNNSGIRVYKWTAPRSITPPDPLKGEETLFYQTPFGYLGTKDLTTGKERLLVNYLSSMTAATANFESVSESFGTPDGPSYQSGMSGYNGGGYGTDRAVMNQKIPVTTDMQALGELTDGGIPTTSLPETIVWAEFGASSLTGTSIDVATGFVKTGIMNYYRDQIGSVRMVTKYDTAGDSIKTVWKGDYTPYGEILTEDYGMNWLPLKTFALHEYDRETGLYYAQARWYDPETSQFVSEDGAQDGLNWYGYCGDRPLGNVDPSGLYGTTGDYGKDHMNGTWGKYNPITYGSGSGSGGGDSGNPAIPTVTPKERTFKEWCDYSWQMTLRHGCDHNSGRKAYENKFGKDDYYYQEWGNEIAKETLTQNILTDLYLKNPVMAFMTNIGGVLAGDGSDDISNGTKDLSGSWMYDYTDEFMSEKKDKDNIKNLIIAGYDYKLKECDSEAKRLYELFGELDKRDDTDVIYVTNPKDLVSTAMSYKNAFLIILEGHGGNGSQGEKGDFAMTGKWLNPKMLVENGTVYKGNAQYLFLASCYIGEKITSWASLFGGIKTFGTKSECPYGVTYFYLSRILQNKDLTASYQTYFNNYGVVWSGKGLLQKK
jgi:RHS repeat-associated protein